jgi:hypothetical protein
VKFNKTDGFNVFEIQAHVKSNGFTETDTGFTHL